MPAWIRIYMRDATPVPPVDQIKDKLDSDWLTLGEQFDLEEDEVDAFMDGLVWSSHEINAEGRRPLQFSTATGKEARAEVAELDERDLDIPAAVRARLAGVTQILAIEMAFTQLETMFETVGFEIAYWLAEMRDGVILGPNDHWFDHDAHRWKPFPSD